METIVVQRLFDAPADFAAVQAAEDRVAWCLGQHRVRFLRSYFALDRRAMVCLYEAPDAEAVRETQRQAGLPLVAAWPATAVGDPPRLAARGGFSTVIAEREFPEPVSRAYIEDKLATGEHCLQLHRAELLVSHLALDGRRMVCVFEAPDAESVRIANRQMETPFSRAWTARLYTP